MNEFSQEFWNSLVRVERIEDTGQANVMILAIAERFHGKIRTLGEITKVLGRSFIGTRFYVTAACDCGQPNCLKQDYHSIGYLEGWLDENKIAHGKQIDLLRFRFVDPKLVTWDTRASSTKD